MVQPPSITCPGCTARMRLDRKTCVRCGHALAPLASPQDRQPATSQTRPSRARLAAVVVAALSIGSVAAIATWWRTAPSEAPTTTSNSEAAAIVAPVGVAPNAGAAPGAAGPAASPSAPGGMPAPAGTDALEELRANVARKPNDPLAFYNLGQALVERGLAKDALDPLQRASEISPDNWVFRFALARAHELAGDAGQSLEGYRAAAALGADFTGLYNLGLALHRGGHDREAVEQYTKAIAAAPSVPNIHLALGVSLERLNRQSEAVRAYQRYLQLDSTSPKGKEVHAHVQQLTSGRS